MGRENSFALSLYLCPLLSLSRSVCCISIDKRSRDAAPANALADALSVRLYGVQCSERSAIKRRDSDIGVYELHPVV